MTTQLLHQSKRNYLKNPDSTKIESHICIICNDLVMNPVQCSGPCKKRYCRSCAGVWKTKQNTCPLKCTNNKWNFQLVPSQKIELNCKFNQKCQIQHVQDFYHHLQNCQFAPTILIEQSIKKREYKCKKGHNLEFFIGSCTKMASSVCAACGQTNLSRSICTKCDQLYCIKCRKPQCSKEGCPNGHPYTLMDKVRSQAYVCGICNEHPFDLNHSVYDDKQCNFAMCQQCFNNLPDKTQKPATTSEKHCQQFHVLSFNKSIYSLECNNCQKLRPCFKKCNQCTTFYCLKCKPIALVRNYCQLNHQFQQVAVEKEGTSCHFCLRQLVYGSQSIYTDKSCGIQFCSLCFGQHYIKQLGKQRLKKFQTCPQQHSLYPIIKDFNMLPCFQCKKNVQLQYVCTKCEPPKFYCYKCKPFSTKDGCLFKHTLSEVPLGGDYINCLFCQKLSNKMFCCEFCQLFICKTCHQKEQ